MNMPRRIALLATIVLISGAVAVGYAFHSLQRTTGSGGPSAANAAEAGSLLQEPHVVFRKTTSGPTYGRVAAVALSAPRGQPMVTRTSCERVYSNGAAGLCLDAKRGVITTHEASLLDSRLRPTVKLETQGEASRVRISPNGRLAATTTFETGHSYLSSNFSTRTVIYDVKTGKVLHNLEAFTVLRGGKPYRNVDINVWGVTFKADGNGFFATVASQGKTYLVEGSMRHRTLRAMKENVECPSLSPDGTRLAYKWLDTRAGFYGWRVHILDLRSGKAIALPETRSVDDQVEWLDHERVLYGLVRQVGYLETDVWVAPADGSGQPTVLIPEAWSPAVVRMPPG